MLINVESHNFCTMNTGGLVYVSLSVCSVLKLIVIGYLFIFDQIMNSFSSIQILLTTHESNLYRFNIEAILIQPQMPANIALVY